MKCSSCGAEITSGTVCEFCGAQISSEERKELEQVSKSGCPKCGSSNVSFSREKQGEYKTSHKGHSATVVSRATVGCCKDCGYTWTSSNEGSATKAPAKRKTWLWVLGWIFCFPIPLAIILLKKDNIKKPVAYVIIAIAAIVYCLWIGGSATSSTSSSSSGSVAVSTPKYMLESNTGNPTNNAIEADSVNAFITAFNKVSPQQMTRFQVTKSYIYHGILDTEDYQSYDIKDLGKSSGDGIIEVSYDISNKYTEEDIEGMYEPFKYVVMAMDPSIGEEDIRATFDSINKGNTDGVSLGKLLVKFSRGVSYQGPWFSVYGNMLS